MRSSRVVLASAILAAAAAAFWWHRADRDAPLPLSERYRFAEIERGPIEQSVSASGTLNPVTLVNVGTQVSGTIRAVHADFNQPVKAGQPLAEIDPSLIEAQLVQLEANLQEASTQLRLAQRKVARSEELVARGFVSGAQLDDERQALEAAQARTRAIQAQIERERTNLGYTVIRSPIDGVVIARTVDVGQTVAASFQTPQLFLIARDLRDMQIDTNVAEADVGSVAVGMPASFRVDALGDRQFEARVRQIRLNPKIEQNVVTYNVVLATRNDDGRLLPGMTATVRIRVSGKPEALKVPSTALRFRPSDPEAAVRQEGARGGRRAVLHVESRSEGRPVLARVPVAVGLSDGTWTELVDAAGLQPGDRVAVGEIVRPATEGGGAGGFRLRLF
jgi:HlyD family secretion protein